MPGENQQIQNESIQALNRPLETWPQVSFAGIIMALIALSLIRVDITDTPWHLATAKYAFTNGFWPVTNTFSYTFPDYPLHQQYPLYQTLLYAIFRLGGWESLSLLHCALWFLIFLLWIRWGGSWKSAFALNLAWLLALLGLHQRMILRPDILTILLLVLLLHSIDLYRSGRQWAAGLFVFIQFLMVNSHQLFPLGLAIQGFFLVHLFLVRTRGGRFGICRADADLPFRPVCLALTGSLLACLVTPLGMDILNVSSQTFGSLWHHRGHVEEFAPFYIDRYVLLLTFLATALVAVAFWRQRDRWQPFELMLWLLGLMLLVAAVRGTALYILISVGIFARSYFREPSNEPGHPGAEPPRRQLLIRVGCAMMTLVICLGILYMRWVSPPRILGGTQPGVGIALGAWPHQSIEFLKKYPPPGKMINLTWYSGNPLIFELYPGHPVFVDPRFEAYPRSFLLEAIRAAEDGEVLQNMIARYQPGWMVVELRVESIRKLAAELVKEGTWKPVFADTVFLIMVRNTPENSAYLSKHELHPDQINPHDFLADEPDLLALQQIRIAGLYRDLGLNKKSREMILAVEDAANRYVTVREALRQFRSYYPPLTRID